MTQRSADSLGVIGSFRQQHRENWSLDFVVADETSERAVLVFVPKVLESPHRLLVTLGREFMYRVDLSPRKRQQDEFWHSLAQRFAGDPFEHIRHIVERSAVCPDSDANHVGVPGIAACVA